MTVADLATPSSRHGAAHAPTPMRAPERAGPPLRIAMVVEAAGGGVAVHLVDLIAGLHARANVEIHLIAPRGARFDEAILADTPLHCASFHRLPFRRSVGLHDVGAARALARLLQEIRPDVVHSHSSKAGALARLCGGPWKQIYTPHAVYTLNPTLSAVKRRVYGGIERWLGNRRSDAVIAVSGDEADHLHALGIARDRIRTIPNGVTPPALLPRAAARAALGVPDDAFVIGFVGRFDAQKGVDRLVRIARALAACDDGRLHIVAIGSGDFNRAAGAEADDLPLNLRVAGRIDNARRYFSAFDVFALPSRYEGFPYVCIEAVAAQVPIVATRVAGAAELVDGHQVGLSVANDDDPREFAAALAHLAGSPARLASMREQCALAARHYSADTMVERTLAVYRERLEEVPR